MVWPFLGRTSHDFVDLSNPSPSWDGQFAHEARHCIVWFGLRCAVLLLVVFKGICSGGFLACGKAIHDSIALPFLCIWVVPMVVFSYNILSYQRNVPTLF